MLGTGYVRTGWVYRVGNTGPYRPRPAEESPPASPSEAGPGSPAGAGVGGEMRAGGDGPCTTPPGPGRALQALPVQDPRRTRLWANTGEN